jgi:hypothetical protein
MTPIRYDILIRGAVLNRIAKRPASPEEVVGLSLMLAGLVQKRRLRFMGLLCSGSIWHPVRSMTTRDLGYFDCAVRRLCGGTFYFDGRLAIINGNLVTLAEDKLIRQRRGQ